MHNRHFQTLLSIQNEICRSSTREEDVNSYAL